MLIKHRLIGLLAVFLSGQLQAFEISGSKWLGAQADYYVDIEGMSATGIAWNTAFIDAMDDCPIVFF